MATKIGNALNTYDISGKYILMVDGNYFYNDYQEAQSGNITVGSARKVVICDTLQEVDEYIGVNGLTLYRQDDPVS